MTQVLTPPVREQIEEAPAEVAPGGKRRFLLAAVLVGVLAGGVAFANFGPSAAELERAHWQAVVDQYDQLYQIRSRSGAAGLNSGAAEQAHWEAVVDYYDEQYQESARPRSGALEDAHWRAVVDYYERQFAAVQS